MGVRTQVLEGNMDRPCNKESPFGAFLASLHSAKDAILPAVSFPSFGRTNVDWNTDVKVIDSCINQREERVACCRTENNVSQFSNQPFQGASDSHRTVTYKESQCCNAETSRCQQYNQPSVPCEGLSFGLLLNQEGGKLNNFTGLSNNSFKGLPVQCVLPKHFTGFSLQSLSHFVPSCCVVLKSAGATEKDRATCGTDPDMAGEMPKFSIASLFQLAVEQCLLASTNFSKQAKQVAPWNLNLVYTINHSRQKMVGYLNENLCISVTLQSVQVDNSLHEQDASSKRSCAKCFKLADLGFARVGGEVNATDSSSNPDRPASNNAARESHGQVEISQLAAGLFRMPIPNIERLRSTLSTVSLTELMELVPQLGKTSQGFPDKKKLFSVQDFFKYTEAEGRRFFEELDRDNDGQVTLEDLEVAMRKRRLPQQYAREFLRQTRKHWFAKSFGWNEFLALMEQKEPMMLRAYNSLNLSKSGTLQKSQVLLSLRSAGLPATEDNVAAMMRCLDADTTGSIAYGQFRNLMLLLPPERLGDDPRMVWFETATVVPMAPPVTVPAESVLKSALAGGLACALSTSLMHPLDTMKTRVQASSSLSFPELISKLPEIGVRGLYRGSIPAILGQFSSHGLRTGIFEASKLLLTNLAPGVPELQVQSLASFASTMLGTAVRIPCEVMKQRLQAGIFDSVGDALIGTWQQDGPRGFFKGTGATLCREVPFYVAGMGIYAEAKKVMQRVLNRELAPWETIAVGAISGGLAAVFTTPFDVMKTRTMTAAPGLSTRMTTIAITIVREEGVLGLFKGAVPRFFWIAPLGAMNFAGYELAKRAMEKQED